MASTSATRIDDDLYASAKVVGEAMSRSASQQIAHWARIGRELEAAGGVSARAVARVLAGRGDYDEVTAFEQAIVRAEWAEDMARRAGDLDFVQESSRAGQSYAELDEHGHAVRRRAPMKRD